MPNNYKKSLSYETFEIKCQPSYTVPEKEWDYIKGMIDKIKPASNLFHTIGSIFIGASLTAAAAWLIDDFSTPASKQTCAFIFWATICIGLLSFYYGKREIKVQNKNKVDVLDMMKLIEDRHIKGKENEK